MNMYRVTTEGDCEGRTTKDLGIHTGNPAIIALNLADKAYYGLEFTLIEPVHHAVVNTDRKEVHVSGFGTRPNNIPFELPDDYQIDKSQFYNSLVIHQKVSVEQSRLAVAAAARAKLTKEERIALGLEK